MHRGEQQVPLTLTEFRLLCELAASPGRVFSRQALLERVWEHGFFGEDSLGRTYAQPGNGFLRAELQNWSAIVKEVTAEVKAEIR